MSEKLQRTNSCSAQAISNLPMQQPNAPELLDCRLHELCSSPTARVTCVNRQHLKMTRTIRVVSQT
eukprot:9265046-Pyramimonas_sp.AAC.1